MFFGFKELTEKAMGNSSKINPITSKIYFQVYFLRLESWYRRLNTFARLLRLGLKGEYN